MDKKKAEKVFIRLGFSDKVISLEDYDNEVVTQDEYYLVGYEDEDGEECEEDGTYLN